MTSIYTKLTPVKRNFFGYTRLWLAPDHVLLLINSRFAEQYKRFALADIQSIVITELPPQVVAQVLMVLAALAWMGLWFAVKLTFFKWTFLITGLLALLWAIRDIARGQRCRCYLHTRVSKELLAPVSHLKVARGFLSAVLPRIEAAQGSLTPGQFDIIEISSPAPLPAPPKLVSSPGYLPEILFAVFLVDAALIYASVLFPKVQEIPGVLINLLLGELTLIVVSLIRRKGRDPRVIIYIVIVLCIAGFGFDMVTFGRQILTWYLATVEKARNSDRTAVMIALFPTGGHRAMIAYSWRAAAGIIGLAGAFYERRKKP